MKIQFNKFRTCFVADSSQLDWTARSGEEGTVSLSFVVARDGHVLDVSLARSSGFAALDGAAVTMLRNAQVPALPASMPQPQLAVTVALRYSLAF